MLVVHDVQLIEVDLRDVCIRRRVDMLGWYNGEDNKCVGIVTCFGDKQGDVLNCVDRHAVNCNDVALTECAALTWYGCS